MYFFLTGKSEYCTEQLGIVDLSDENDEGNDGEPDNLPREICKSR